MGSEPHTAAELEKIYSARFSGLEEYRTRVWRILTSTFFTRWVNDNESVLDLGCGYGEFINNVAAREKFAMDLNPAAKGRIEPDVRLIQQDCRAPWPIRDNSLDVVFTSNFFEHLPSKRSLQKTLLEAHRCLKPGGRLIALGPNIKHLPGAYWDFFDHHLALTDLSIAEALSMAGFRIQKRISRFLPYTMSQTVRPPVWTVRVYLALPVTWKIFGKQFLVVGCK